MKNIWFIPLLLLGCTSIQQPISQQIDPELAPLYQEFLTDYRRLTNGPDLPFVPRLVFIEADNNILGSCYEDQSIEINRLNIDDDPCQLRVTVYHELGHCLLSLDHRDDRIDIMNATVEPVCAIYLYEWERMLDQLFLDK